MIEGTVAPSFASGHHFLEALIIIVELLHRTDSSCISLGGKGVLLSSVKSGSYRHPDIHPYSRLIPVHSRFDVNFGAFLRVVLELVGSSAVICEAMCIDAQCPVVLHRYVWTMRGLVAVHEE